MIYKALVHILAEGLTEAIAPGSTPPDGFVPITSMEAQQIRAALPV